MNRTPPEPPDVPPAEGVSEGGPAPRPAGVGDTEAGNAGSRDEIRVGAVRDDVRAIAADKGHAVDNARRAIERLDRAFADGDLEHTPSLDAMMVDLRVALDAEVGQRLGGKSAEAARFILRAISRELDRA